MGADPLTLISSAPSKSLRGCLTQRCRDVAALIVELFDYEKKCDLMWPACVLTEEIEKCHYNL